MNFQSIYTLEAQNFGKEESNFIFAGPYEILRLLIPCNVWGGNLPYYKQLQNRFKHFPKRDFRLSGPFFNFAETPHNIFNTFPHNLSFQHLSSHKYLQNQDFFCSIKIQCEKTNMIIKQEIHDEIAGK